MTSRETETHCIGLYSSDKGSFKNTILISNELNKVLEYHNVPSEVKSLIQNMYKDFCISVGTKHFITDQIKVER